jgi:hypothetical protein
VGEKNVKFFLEILVEEETFRDLRQGKEDNSKRIRG